MNINTSIKNDQSGFAAIIVTLIIMAILVLLMIGFFYIVSREQRATIDRQLSAQAFYAAETGINDAVAAIADADAGGLEDINTCDDFQNSNLNDKKTLSTGDDSVQYTCVLVDKRPSSLEYGSVETSQPTVALIQGVNEDGDPRYINELTISWQAEGSPDGGFPITGGDTPGFPDTWSHAAPVLRITLTDVNELFRASLINNNATDFLWPEGSSSPAELLPSHIISFGASQRANNGRIRKASCHKDRIPRFCSIKLTGLNRSQYLLTLRSVYDNADVYITARNISSGGSTVYFANQQAVIDSTGRASDVLRRVQVRVPLRNQYTRPGFSLEAGAGICKPYAIRPGSGNNNNSSGVCDITN
ncbi:hypothetical protein BH23PAT2_BH23PAT2_03220 [soil metagenome]